MPGISRVIVLLAALLCSGPTSADTFAAAAPETPQTHEREFSRFAATLPPGWDGEERTGFSTATAEKRNTCSSSASRTPRANVFSPR